MIDASAIILRTSQSGAFRANIDNTHIPSRMKNSVSFCIKEFPHPPAISGILPHDMSAPLTSFLSGDATHR